MKINPAIFKLYDIRAIYPAEINGQVAEKIGSAAVQYFSRIYRKKKPVILVCRDTRSSGETLKKSLIEGILSNGGDVLDLGVGTTPFFYYLMHTIKADGGIMVSASHNPAAYNGFKIRGRGAKAIFIGAGLEKIKALALRESSKYSSPRGKILPVKIDYRQKDLSFLGRQTRIKPIRAVIDASGAAASILLPGLLEKFPQFQYKPLFFEVDGSFRNHSPNPLLSESQQHVRRELKTGKFRFGAIFDSDGDRVIFFDEKGNQVPAEFAAGLIMLDELKKDPKSQFIFSINTSRGIREYLAERGAKIRVSRVGYAFVQAVMKKYKAAVGTETSGHYYFRDAYFDDCALMALLRLAEILSRTHRRFSELILPFRRYYSQGELNFTIKKKEQLLSRIKKFYRSKGVISLLDGITVEAKDWWFNIRPSNTEPIIRLVLETRDKKNFEQKLQEIKKIASI